MPFKAIIVGSRFAFGITDNCELYATGANEAGQLGLGATYESSLNHFTIVPCGFKVRQVACGWAHTIVLSEDGRIFVCGDSKKGQLGKQYDVQNQNRFIEIKIENERIIQVACGLTSCFVVTESGKVLFWGHFRTIKPEICWNPTVLNEMKNVSKIAVGHKHILTKSSDGRVSGFGCNKYNQIAFNHNDLDVIDIFAGWNHSIFRLKSNDLVLIGKNDHNQLAHPETECHRNIIHFKEENIVDLAVGSDHALLQTSKRILVWGWNEHGILGQNHTNQVYGPSQELKFDINRIERIFCGPVSCFIITK